MEFKPGFLACAVGSMPHADPAAAIDVILANLPEAPVSPQLSGRGLNEQMEIQYSEGMPCRVIDREKGRMYFETSGDYIEAFTEFYEAYIQACDPDDGTGDVSSMAISPDYARTRGPPQSGRRYAALRQVPDHRAVLVRADNCR